MMRLKNRKPLSKEARKDRIIYGLVILGMLTLLFGYSIAFCAVSTNLSFEGSGTVEAKPGTYYYNKGYFYTDLTQANNENASYRVKKNGSDVQTLSDLMDVMEKNSDIYIMSQYEVDSAETVTVSKGVNIYFDEFDTSNYAFGVRVLRNLTIQTVDDGSLNITNLSKNFDGMLFAVDNSVLTLNGKIKISDFSSNRSYFMNFYNSTLNLTNTEITKIECVGFWSFSGSGSFTFDSVNIHDNKGPIYSNADTRKITGSSVIYNNFTSSGGSGNLSGISSQGIDGTGLTSDSKIGVVAAVPTANAPVTLFTNIDRSEVSPGVNILSDNANYNTAYGDDNDTTTIVLKVPGPYYYNGSYFYTSDSGADSKCQVKRNGSAITKMSDMVDFMYDDETIYMMSTYNTPYSGETVTVKNKKVKIYRYNDIDLFKLSGNFRMQTEGKNLNDENSLLYIDGDKDNYGSTSRIFYGRSGYDLYLIGHVKNSIQLTGNYGTVILSENSTSCAELKYVYIYSNTGRVFYYSGEHLYMDSCYIYSNSVSNSTSIVGDAVIHLLFIDDCKIENSEISYNHNYEHAVIYAQYTTDLYMLSCNVHNNDSRKYGGGIYVGSRTTAYISGETYITDNKVTQNYNGGGIYADAGATVYISGTTNIADNGANYGGGIYIKSDTRNSPHVYANVYLSGTTNITDNNGGAVYCEGYLYCVDGTVTFSGNVARSVSYALYFTETNGFKKKRDCTVNYAGQSCNVSLVTYT